MNAWTVELAEERDADWLRPIFAAERRWLWDFGRVWWRYWHQRRVGEAWYVVREAGFVHWHARRDGVRVVEEIAVARDARRQGVGRALLAAIGQPILLKTDADNAESNPFYAALGFRYKETVASRDDTRRLNVYER